VSAVLEAREPSARYLEAVQPALVRQFELLATAPGGVARLREFILSLAVQGKLTAQDCDEEPASALLQRIHDRKLRSIASGAIKQGKQPAELDDAEPMFELPKGWTWTRLGELCSYIQRGKGPAYAEHSEHKVISQKCVRWYGLDLAPARFVTAESLAKYEPVRFLRAGDLLWNSTGTGTIGRACVVPIELDDAGLVADSHVTVVRPIEVNSVFLWRWIQSPFVQNEIEGSASGTTNQIELNTSTVVNQPVPLPPLAEQARIVARVDELTQLCDALEAKGRLEAQQHAHLLETLLGTLTESTTSEELAANWQRVVEHFDLLMDRPEAVDVLEQTVLQLAVRGLLVPQDPREEPGIVLLEQIQAAKAAGPTNSRNHRVRAELPEVGEHERPFEPPPGWVWTRFGEVTHVSGGVTLGRKGAIAKPLSLPYLRVANVQRWKLAMDSLKDVVIDESELPRYQLVNGDLLITEGGDWDKVGRTSIWRGELPICLHQNHVFKARGYIGAWHPGWAELYLNLDFARSYFAVSAKQTTNLASINMTELRHCAFPLPPRAEQDRILARATELRKLCADLRRRLVASQATQSQLAEALVDSATT
jgi:type I restriction enzyme S subunit